MEISAFLNKGPIKLYHYDNIEVLKTIESNSIDLIFADPPYGLSNDGVTCESGKMVSVNKGKWDKSNGAQEDYNFHEKWILNCKRVLKPSGSIWISGTYHSIGYCMTTMMLDGWKILNDIIWYKRNPPPQLTKTRFKADHEILIWARKDPNIPSYFNYDLAKNKEWEEDFLKNPGKQMGCVWAIKRIKAEEKKFGKHPTQKPEGLLERIILTCSKEGDVVLDPFCGSGTSGVVSIENKRKFIGIDIDKDYLKRIATRRILETLTNTWQG